jgi:hypothetical protein
VPKFGIDASERTLKDLYKKRNGFLANNNIKKFGKPGRTSPQNNDIYGFKTKKNGYLHNSQKIKPDLEKTPSPIN